jgi:Protein of unknown function (DUF2569)
MGSVSAWFWSIVFVMLVIGVPIWGYVRHRRQRALDGPAPPPVGIGGWLGLLAVALCAGLVLEVFDLVQDLPDYLSALANLVDEAPIVVIGVITLAYLALHFWLVVALLRKKRMFRRLFLIFWIVTPLVTLSDLLTMMAPGVTFGMALPMADIGRGIIAPTIGLGLWYWYLSVSARVKNTMVN